MKSIIAFGDSITFGRFDESNGGWVARLKKYYEEQNIYHAVYNQGVPGDTSKGLLQRIDVECRARAKYAWKGDTHLVLIAIGINDTRGIDSPDNIETSPQEFENNIKKIISIAQQHTKHIAIIGITPVNETITAPFENTFFTNKRIEEYNNILRTICDTQNITFVDVYKEMKNKESLLADGLHPNAKGYDLMYRIILQALRNTKAIT